LKNKLDDCQFSSYHSLYDFAPIDDYTADSLVCGNIFETPELLKD